MHVGVSIDDVGVSRNTVFQEIRPGAGFETAEFVNEKVGGATVVRLDRGSSYFGQPFCLKDGAPKPINPDRRNAVLALQCG